MSNKVRLTFTRKSQLSSGFSCSSTSLINNADTGAWQRQALGLSPSHLARVVTAAQPKILTGASAPGEAEDELRSWWGKLPCCSGAAFRRKFLFPLGFRAWFWFFGCFTPVRNKKKWIPRFAPVEKLHLYDLEKNKCVFFMSEIQREHRAVATGSQHNPALGKTPIHHSISYVLENVTLMTQKVISKN